jgi:hypothetical protein
MREVEHDTGSTLARRLVPLLGVSCRRCRHRTLLSTAQLQAHENDRRQLARLPLLCRCGSKDVVRVLLDTPDEPQAFLAGHDPVELGDQRNDGLWSPSF